MTHGERILWSAVFASRYRFVGTSAEAQLVNVDAAALDASRALWWLRRASGGGAYVEAPPEVEDARADAAVMMAGGPDDST